MKLEMSGSHTAAPVQAVAHIGKSNRPSRIRRRSVRELEVLLDIANIDLATARVAAADEAVLTRTKIVTMAHEFRTPMNSVLGYAQLIEMRTDEPASKKAAHLIVKSGEHLLCLIKDALQFEIAPPEDSPYRVEPVLLAQVIHDAIDLVRPIASNSNVRVESSDWDSCGVKVMANFRRLVQVVTNLLSNAVKFNSPDGWVKIKCASEENGVQRIEVQDSGSGISARDQLMLFRPFQRVGDRQTEGTGLGLVISRAFMERMGGKLGLLRSSEEGSTFFLDIPAVNPVNLQPAA